MKKIISFILSLMLVLPLAGMVVAYWNEDWIPTGDWLGYNGKIAVYFTHDYSVTFRDYTAEDFPELDIEHVKNYWVDPARDIEEMKNNLYFRRSVEIVLKDKSEKSIRSAVYYLDSLSYVDEALALSDRIREGDVNCDRTVDLKDVTHMMKYIAEWNSVHIEFHRTADMNIDGLIGLNDVSILLQVIAGWDGWNDIGFEAGPY